MPVKIMGVLNVTPDSFSDGGLYLDPHRALERAHQMLDEGADIIDIGGESTRPGATPVGPDVEWERVSPVIEALVGHCVLSVDTRHPKVARAAVDCGVSILNDVSASLSEVAAQNQVTWIAMHMQREPSTMQRDPRYIDVVAEVRAYLAACADDALRRGVPEVLVDPGIGFGKSFQHNLELLRHLDAFAGLAHGLVLGVSRKSVLGEAIGQTDPLRRLPAALAVSALAVGKGVSIIRTHDVAETIQAVRMAEFLQG
ncbi:dihydropteroate synthase [Nocardia sputi]|uniref:dihydropteroate synthase n=1 Tax=Nocardia sputi TaxID=2943705 RepID=UPI0020BE2944|nr:dihydropteroate synthase [Nocardia sputi]